MAAVGVEAPTTVLQSSTGLGPRQSHATLGHHVVRNVTSKQVNKRNVTVCVYYTIPEVQWWRLPMKRPIKAMIGARIGKIKVGGLLKLKKKLPFLMPNWLDLTLLVVGGGECYAGCLVYGVHWYIIYKYSSRSYWNILEVMNISRPHDISQELRFNKWSLSFSLLCRCGTRHDAIEVPQQHHLTPDGFWDLDSGDFQIDLMFRSTVTEDFFLLV